MFESEDEEDEEFQPAVRSVLPLFTPAPAKKKFSKLQIEKNESLSGSQEEWKFNSRRKLPGPRGKLYVKGNVVGMI